MSVTWKVGFHPAFDPEFEALALEVQDELLAQAKLLERKAILLVAGDKSGIGDGRFYRQLIKKADERFAQHLGELEEDRRTR